VIRLALALICLCGTALADPSLRPNGTWRWKLDAPWFGGWSGIEVRANGTEMTVVSDRGQLVDADIRRKDGRILGVDVHSSIRVNKSSGGRLRKKASDAEALAFLEGGSAFISFEHRHRIMQLDLKSGRTRGRIKLPFVNEMGDNSGVEALAIGPDGTLYALIEKAPDNGQPFPLYAYSNGKWRVSARIPQRGPFVPVGADFDPFGRLWLLERATTPVGFRSRVRLFSLAPGSAREYTMFTSLPSRYDNLEGISVWQDPSGRLHVTMISDDNFLRLQRTQIVEFIVRE
jgi:hypothetical protein